MVVSIADIFAARLDELKRKDEESQRKTQETLASLKGLIKELEELDFTDAE